MAARPFCQRCVCGELLEVSWDGASPSREEGFLLPSSDSRVWCGPSRCVFLGSRGVTSLPRDSACRGSSGRLFQWAPTLCSGLFSGGLDFPRRNGGTPKINWELTRTGRSTAWFWRGGNAFP